MIAALLELYLNHFLLFILILTRVSGLVMTAPVFGARGMPMRVRALFAAGLALFITPLHTETAIAQPASILNLAVVLGLEAVLGLALGLAVLILFTGVQLCGQIISQMSGMQLADVFDPGFDTNVPVFARLLDLVTVAVFVAIGGHRLVMGALLDTFLWIPPGQAAFSNGLVDAITTVTAQSFALGVRTAAPVMVALLLAVLTLGLISRTLPQLNVLAVGFSLNSLIMMVVLAASLGSVAWIFHDQAEAVLDTMRFAFRSVLVATEP